jgi:ubiquinone/menaquinone biosynthesis C-methylase UbiE
MSCGSANSRRLVEVPTGHQLRSSVEALEVFQLVAQEVARVALGRPVAGSIPNLMSLEAKRVSERARLPKVDARLQELWRDYLVGRDGRLGIELMNATTAYDDLMRLQIAGLRLKVGHRVADVGSGTGSFPIALLAREDTPSGLTIHEIDFVAEAHARARERLRSIDARGSGIEFIQCNLDDATARNAAFSTTPYDASLASWVLGYLPDPLSVLKDLRLALRSGGRLVVSAMRRDADVSRLFVEAIEELRDGRARSILGEEGERILDVSARQFLNDAARVLDLEEAGIFRFLDSNELRDLVQAAGFEPIEEHFAFGNPPQAVVLIAERRG